MTPTVLWHEFAGRMGATSREIHASHSVMLSQPLFVADLIIEAAKKSHSDKESHRCKKYLHPQSS